eukprot:IDg2149t1
MEVCEFLIDSFCGTQQKERLDVYSVTERLGKFAERSRAERSRVSEIILKDRTGRLEQDARAPESKLLQCCMENASEKVACSIRYGIERDIALDSLVCMIAVRSEEKNTCDIRDWRHTRRVLETRMWALLLFSHELQIPALLNIHPVWIARVCVLGTE